ncbi:cytochrome c biogenesis CcdA family protein [Prochlorococcus sp. MIT 1300]|uniref:cytochrome c biogenesis CcdA family protein n=1 Tax=Prochlorococcus sp. MIT 1300 TaxID=3096218 RepID=UPI002A75D53E|nr:cytochrome c biogenesis CcdA family protein [Prochlorococcus sp. MIT 1300]
MELAISDLARISEQLLTDGLSNPGPLTLLIVFLGGLLTSLGPCSLSLLPITVAYLAGFENQQNAFQRSLAFCSGIVGALVILGSLSGFIGRLYGQLPSYFPNLVAVLAVVMGLNLLGLIKIPLPIGPDPSSSVLKRIPPAIAPVAAGLTFGLASSPCTTPVLAVLLGWISQSENPILGMIMLACFGIGQVIPLLLAGTAAAVLPGLLALKPIGSWIPPISGALFLSIGLLSLLSRWI